MNFINSVGNISSLVEIRLWYLRKNALNMYNIFDNDNNINNNVILVTATLKYNTSLNNTLL